LRVNQVLLVDGHAYAYRAFYAIPDMRSPDGMATNAIFGFVKMFEKARALVGPSHVAVLWDGGLDVGRVEALPGYKGQRPEMPDDLEAQLDKIQSYLEAMGICSVCEEGVEADDLIAAVARKATLRDWSTVIASSDKDFMQLVSPLVRLLNPGDKQQPIWDSAKVVEKTGVHPTQIADWLSLVGDTVDNIGGVRGVGPKTAAKLLNEHETVEGLYERLDHVQPERLRTALSEARSVVFRNKSLVELKADAAAAPELEACEPGSENRSRLRELFATWGFRSLAVSYADEPKAQELPF
jgi:DNA polymerase-1